MMFAIELPTGVRYAGLVPSRREGIGGGGRQGPGRTRLGFLRSPDMGVLLHGGFANPCFCCIAMFLSFFGLESLCSPFWDPRDPSRALRDTLGYHDWGC